MSRRSDRVEEEPPSGSTSALQLADNGLCLLPPSLLLLFFFSFCPIRLSPPSFAPLVVKDIIRHILNQNDTFRPALDLLRRRRLAKNDTSGFSLIEISILMFICYLWVAGRRGGMGGIRIECVCRSVVGASCDTQIETEGYHLTPAAES